MMLKDYPYISLVPTKKKGILFINPKIYCPPTIGVHREPNPDCQHEWVQNSRDDYATWKCKKCDGKVGADVWD